MTTLVRVLLFAPLAGYDPLSGDTSYTDALCSDPPPGVTYTSYVDAIADGTVRVLGRKPWFGVGGATDLGAFALRLMEHAARRSGLMFREPVIWVRITPGVYDVVHQHLFPVRQVGRRVPVVSGAGYPLSELYRWREGWGQIHLALATALEATLTRWAGIHNPWLAPGNGGLMTVYTEHFRSWLLKRGIAAESVRVVSTALQELGGDRAPQRRSGRRTIGFVGRDFERKGGDIAVDALKVLRRTDPSWRLIVATSSGAAKKLRSQPGVEVLIEPSRENIRENLLPSIDILLQPTRSDCGAPYAVLEALQLGVPVVLTDDPWLDDRLCPPAVERTPREATAVAAAVRLLASRDPDALGRAARELWRTSFSMSVLHPQLLDAYAAVKGSAPPARAVVNRRLRILVAARPYDLEDRPYDGFALRHRRLVNNLGTGHDVVLADVEQVPRPAGRVRRLIQAVQSLLGRETASERARVAPAGRMQPDVVLTVGPWLEREFEPFWRRWPSVHLHEEDLTRMRENAPQSPQARLLRLAEVTLRSFGPAQPSTVVAINHSERRSLEWRYRRSAHAVLPYTLDPSQWPVTVREPIGDWVVVAGNLGEARNAEGLAEIFEHIDLDEQASAVLRICVTTGAGWHPCLRRWTNRRWLVRIDAAYDLRAAYDRAWAALVPARRVTGQKVTILQAWSRSVPVVAFPAAAASVAASDAVVTALDARDVVEQLLRLLADLRERQRLAVAGRKALQTRFDPAEEVRTLERLLAAADYRGRAKERGPGRVR